MTALHALSYLDVHLEERPWTFDGVTRTIWQIVDWDGTDTPTAAYDRLRAEELLKVRRAVVKAMWTRRQNKDNRS
jgi:hypothetical protein